MEFITLDWVLALLTLTSLEIVLGIDNIILIAILSDRLPAEKRVKARRLGLVLALIFRVLLLSTISWLAKLTDPVIHMFNRGLSIRDIILAVGGLFLLAKATTEIFNYVELKEKEHPSAPNAVGVSIGMVLFQIILFDIVFSLDSVLTAIGLTQDLLIMVLAVLISIVVMIIFVNKISDFVAKNPSIKLLALSFLVLIGVLLLAEGFGSHFEKGYVYFAMAFSLGIELLNKRRRSNEAGGG